MLAHLFLTFQHRAGVRPYTSSFDFAESCVFVKQSLPSILCHLLKVALKKVPFLPKLQGQFAEFLQHDSLNAFVFSTRPPVSVSGTVYTWGLFPGRVHLLSIIQSILTNFSLRHSPTGHRILTAVPIDYDFRPRLRGRLTLR